MTTLSIHDENIGAAGDAIDCKKPRMDEQVIAEVSLEMFPKFPEFLCFVVTTNFSASQCTFCEA